jgi:hypothetical protein
MLKRRFRAPILPGSSMDALRRRSSSANSRTPASEVVGSGLFSPGGFRPVFFALVYFLLRRFVPLVAGSSIICVTFLSFAGRMRDESERGGCPKQLARSEPF